MERRWLNWIQVRTAHSTDVDCDAYLVVAESPGTGTVDPMALNAAEKVADSLS